jgi:hypothetical protein
MDSTRTVADQYAFFRLPYNLRAALSDNDESQLLIHHAPLAGPVNTSAGYTSHMAAHTKALPQDLAVGAGLKPVATLALFNLLSSAKTTTP